MTASYIGNGLRVLRWGVQLAVVANIRYDYHTIILIEERLPFWVMEEESA